MSAKNILEYSVKKDRTKYLKTIEHEIQSCFIDWVRWTQNHDDRLKLLFAVPNGGMRAIKTAVALKAEGVISGVPDVIFPFPMPPYSGLAIEFKRPKGKLSETQREYGERLKGAGWNVQVHYSAQTAIDSVKQYLRMK